MTSAAFRWSKLGIDLGHDRGGVAQDRPRGVQAKLPACPRPGVVAELVGVPLRDLSLAPCPAIPVRTLDRIGDGAAVTVGVVALPRLLPRLRLLALALRRLDLRLAGLALGCSPLGLGFEGLEQERFDLRAEPGTEDHLGPGTDEDGAPLPVVLGLVGLGGVLPGSAPAMLMSTVRIMQTSPGRMPVSRWSSIIAHTWRPAYRA